MTLPSNLTLVINLGEYPDSGVSQALTALLLALSQSQVDLPGAITVDDRQWVTLNDLRDFFVDHEGCTETRAYGYADRAMKMLLKLAGEGLLVAFCTSCGQQRGTCRCPHQVLSAPRDGGPIHYYVHSGGWSVSRQSLLALTDQELRRISAPAAQRVKRFVAHLQT